MGKYKTIARARWTLDIFHIFMKKKEKHNLIDLAEKAVPASESKNTSKKG